MRCMRAQLRTQSSQSRQGPLQRASAACTSNGIRKVPCSNIDAGPSLMTVFWISVKNLLHPAIRFKCSVQWALRLLLMLSSLSPQNQIFQTPSTKKVSFNHIQILIMI